MITLKQINYALSVSRNLHFKKAADECSVSPSTLSNAITEMENQLGYEIFERDNKIGGLLRYGIPDFKMEKHIIDRRLEIIIKEGVIFKCNVNVGKNISTKELEKNYDIILRFTYVVTRMTSHSKCFIPYSVLNIP